MKGALSAVTTGGGYAAAVVTVPLALGVIALRRIFGFSRRFDPLLRFVAAAIPGTFGIQVRCTGLPHLLTLLTLQEGPVIVMANHVNIFDGFVLRGHLPASLAFRALELTGHFSWPVYGTATRLYGNIAIPHNSPRAALRSLARAQKTLASGTSLLILPEGHRTRTGGVGPLMTGPFRLAAAAGVAIVPVALVGAWERKRVGSPRVRPGTITVRVGTPISAQTIAALTPRQLRDLTHQRISALTRSA